MGKLLDSFAYFILVCAFISVNRYPVKDLIKSGSALRQFAPALLHQLDAFQGRLVRGHSGPAHWRRLLHLTDDLC